MGLTIVPGAALWRRTTDRTEFHSENTHIILGSEAHTL